MELQQIHNRLQYTSLFGNAGIGILIVDEDGFIVFANKYILKALGYDEEELILKKVELLIPSGVKEKHCGIWGDLTKHPENISFDANRNYTLTRKNGTEIQVEMTFGFYQDGPKVFFSFFINCGQRLTAFEQPINALNRDEEQKSAGRILALNLENETLKNKVRELEEMDARLEDALEKERELNQLKAGFLTVASNEFRTPLSGILSSTYLLSKYTSEEEQPQRDKHIKRILSSVNQLNEILGDFLSVEKIDQGNFKPNLSAIHISLMVNEVIRNINYMLRNGQEIVFTQSGDNDIAYIDYSMFVHILTNLLSNAIKYSPEHSLISLHIQSSQNLVIKIKDTGIGIPENEKDNLYKMFFRCSNASNIQGSGLGLNLVKKYIGLLNGTIDFISEENKGTEFTITFQNEKLHYENNTGS
jgi:PAS domain S-box-containing protein